MTQEVQDVAAPLYLVPAVPTEASYSSKLKRKRKRIKKRSHRLVSEGAFFAILKLYE